MLFQLAMVTDDRLPLSMGADMVYLFPNIIAGLLAVYFLAVKKDKWALCSGFLFTMLLPLFVFFSGTANIGWLSAILGVLLLNSYALAFIHSPLLDGRRIWILAAFTISASGLACLRIAGLNI